MAVLDMSVHKLDKQIENVVLAITEGRISAALKDKLAALEEERDGLINRKSQIQTEVSNQTITPEVLQRMAMLFQQFVKENNIPECRSFIETYVERVLLYNDRVEATFRVASAPVYDEPPSGITISTSETKKNVIKGKYRKKGARTRYRLLSAGV
jgi:site-specific DNA recombinase